MKRNGVVNGFNSNVKIKEIWDWVRLEIILLPYFQRFFVWNSENIKDFFNGIYTGLWRGSSATLTFSNVATDCYCRKFGELYNQLFTDGVCLVTDAQQRISSLLMILYNIVACDKDGKSLNYFLFFKPIEEDWVISKEDREPKRGEISIYSLYSTFYDAKKEFLDSNLFENTVEKQNAEQNIDKLYDKLNNFGFHTSCEDRTIAQAMDEFEGLQKGVVVEPWELVLGKIKTANFHAGQMIENIVFDKEFHRNCTNTTPSLQHSVNSVCFLTDGKWAKNKVNEEMLSKLPDVVDSYCNRGNWENFQKILTFIGDTYAEDVAEDVPFDKIFTKGVQIHLGYSLYLLLKRKYPRGDTRIDRYIKKWLWITTIINRYSTKKSLQNDINKFYLSEGNMELKYSNMDSFFLDMENNIDQLEFNTKKQALKYLYLMSLRLNRDEENLEISDIEKLEYIWRTYKEKS